MIGMFVFGFVVGLIFVLILCGFSEPLIDRLLQKKLERKREKKRKKLMTHPVKGLPNIEAEVFEQRVRALETWRKSHDGVWTSPGVEEWRLGTPNIPNNMVKVGFKSEYERIIECYEKLDSIDKAHVCPSGYRYLAVEFYYADLAIKDLVNQAHRLMSLKELSGDELLPNEKIGSAISELRAGVNLIVERHYEGELLELVKMAVVEQLGANDALCDKLPPGSPCHTTTAEEITRLKLLTDSILTGSRGDQPVSITDIYPEKAESV